MFPLVDNALNTDFIARIGNPLFQRTLGGEALHAEDFAAQGVSIWSRS